MPRIKNNGEPDTRGRWKEHILAGVDPRRVNASLTVNYPNSWVKMLKLAAARRDMSLLSYTRRAVAAFACYDLGIPWDDMMVNEPAVKGYGDLGGEVRVLQGKGHGDWVIESLEHREA